MKSLSKFQRGQSEMRNIGQTSNRDLSITSQSAKKNTQARCTLPSAETPNDTKTCKGVRGTSTGNGKLKNGNKKKNWK